MEVVCCSESERHLSKRFQLSNDGNFVLLEFKSGLKEVDG